MAIPTMKVQADPQAVATAAADYIVEAAHRAIQDHGHFSIALSGGSTPKTLYELLASPAYRDKIQWPAVDFYFSDERCVPTDHPDSNFRMANNALLTHIPLPPHQVNRMRGEIEPEAAAREYGQLLRAKFDDGGLDLTLLGMGDDGHTASLFPYSNALDETHHRCVANYVEKFRSYRITMTAPFINRSSAILMLAVGANKAARIKEVLQGVPDPRRLPIQLINPENGTYTWIVDKPAADL